MKRLLAATIFAFLLFAAADSRGVVRQLAPNVWVRMGNRDKNQPANTGWVVFKDYVVVIDANYPWGAKEILPEIKKTTSKPIRYVFNTHYHGDHAYGGSIFTDQGAAIVCSQDCAAESRTKGQEAWDKTPATGEYSLKPYKLAHPTISFAQGMTFDDGTQKLELSLVGPGHSKGDSVAWLPKEKILFTGDLCVNWKFGNNVADADADPDNWIRILGKLQQWGGSPIGTLVPGHGELGGVPELRAQAAYLKDMVDGTRAGIRAGKPADQIAKDLNLTKHQIGTDPARNAASIKAVYKKLAGK